MIAHFSLILLLGTVFTGLCLLSYPLLLGRGARPEQPPKLIEYCRALFPTLLLVFILRSFVVQLYHVPSGSLEPSVLPGELVLANQYEYGLHFPIWRTWFFKRDNFKRGQIVLFHDPVNPRVILIKRLIGLPGDHISYINKVLYINNQRMTQQPKGNNVFIEHLGPLSHLIQVESSAPQNFYNYVVPKERYFVMGDNRDNSDDSRYWGSVPRDDFIGSAMRIVLSWNVQAKHWYQLMRWERLGVKL